MPYVLDTDTISALQHEDRHVVAHVKAVPALDIFVTIVSLQEQMAGRLSTLNKQLTLSALIMAYGDLADTLEFYVTSNILPYDVVAAGIDNDLRAKLRRMGTFDRRIAAITLTHGCVLVTRNTVDFKGVPGLIVEDWVAP